MAKSPRAPSSSNQNLTNVQKQQVLAHYNAQRSLNPSYHQKDLANWIRDTFSLSYTPPAGPPSTGFCTRASSLMILHHPARKRMSSRSEELDRELAEGVVRQQERKVMVNGHLIRQQGSNGQTAWAQVL